MCSLISCCKAEDRRTYWNRDRTIGFEKRIETHAVMMDVFMTLVMTEDVLPATQ